MEAMSTVAVEVEDLDESGLLDAAAAAERLTFDMSRLEHERLEAQKRADVALARLHESDATLAAVADAGGATRGAPAADRLLHLGRGGHPGGGGLADDLVDPPLDQSEGHLETLERGLLGG